MNNYRLSRQAEQDLEDLWTYLAQKNEIASDIFLAKVLNKFSMLAQYPEMGQARKDLLGTTILIYCISFYFSCLDIFLNSIKN
jgi:plasmid stabilization system protein ParE